MSWTNERVELLKKLWAEGHSASQIAGELGGVTRNAVIGKVHRLGLSGRAKAPTSASKPRRSRAAGSSSNSSPSRSSATQPQTRGATALKFEATPAPAAEVEKELEPVAELVPLSERTSILSLTERTCKWPIGDPGSEDFYFCGRPTQAGAPYCSYHCRIAYQPVNDRRRERRAANTVPTADKEIA